MVFLEEGYYLTEDFLVVIEEDHDCGFRFVCKEGWFIEDVENILLSCLNDIARDRYELDTVK